MKTVTRHVCEKCEKPIDPGCGVVLDSDISLITEYRGEQMLHGEHVAGKTDESTAYHIGCMIEILREHAVKYVKPMTVDVFFDMAMDLDKKIKQNLNEQVMRKMTG